MNSTTLDRTLARRLGALAVTATLATGLAACGGGDATSDSGGSSGGSGDAGSVAAGPAPAAEPAAGSGAGLLQDKDSRLSAANAYDSGATDALRAPAGAPDAAEGKPASRLPDDSFLGRSVIATAQVSVRTTDVGKARDEVGDVIRRYVGYVADERTERNRKGETVRSVMQLRIPTPKFDQALADLEELAPQVDIDRSTEDVTQQVIDVASRIRTQEVSLTRLRGFLGKATTVDGIVRLESEIARREGDLGSLRAQQRQLRDLTSESTITVRLQHVEKAKPEPEPKQAGTGFVAGLSTGWGAFVSAMVGLSQAVGVVLPFAVLLALLGVPLLLWLRRRGLDKLDHRGGTTAEQV